MKSTLSLVAAAAVAGLFAGVSTAHADTITSQAALRTTSSRTTALRSTSIAGQKAQNLDSSAGKHDCKGKNDCKGQGGCKSGDNGCKAKNSCKGKGGCNTNTSSKPGAI